MGAYGAVSILRRTGNPASDALVDTRRAVINPLYFLHRLKPDDAQRTSAAVDAQNRSNLFPANAPIDATIAVAIEYHVITKSGESSVQFEAYKVAARPEDNNPAMAPVSAGREGAPWRRPISAAASSGNDIRGIVVRQIRELLPMRRAIIGRRCGSIISPAIPATKRPTGITRSHSQPRREASGRERWRLIAIAGIARPRVTANLRLKNGL